MYLMPFHLFILRVKRKICCSLSPVNEFSIIAHYKYLYKIGPFCSLGLEIFTNLSNTGGDLSRSLGK